MSSRAPNSTPPRHTILCLALVAGLFGLSPTVAAESPPPLEIAVDCDAGQTLQPAVDRRPAGAVVITFQGTCDEEVVIRRDDVSLRGAAGAAVLAGALTVEAAERVEIAGFTVQARPDLPAAISVVDARSFALRDLAVHDAGATGVAIDASQGSIENLSVDRSGAVGLSIASSRIRLSGALEANDNGASGVDAQLGSDLTFDGSRIRTERNLLGFVLRDASVGALSGGELTSLDNDLAGIVIAIGSSLTYGGTAVTANDNGRGGLLITERSSFLPAGFGARLEFSRNGFAGIVTQEFSSLSLSGVGGQTAVRDNSCFGLLIDGSKALLLNSSVTGNDLQNARLLFGSHVTSGPIELPLPIFCEDSVLSRGTDVCAAVRAAGGDELAAVAEEPLPSAREIVAPSLEALGISGLR